MTITNNRILAKGKEISNDTHATRLNNNDLIIGATGTGKTTGYVIPNMLRMNSSMVVADTKGNLCKKLSPILKKNGFKVDVLDFMDPDGVSCYNPLDYISFDESTEKYKEQDIMTIANSIIPDTVCKHDTFWPASARTLLACLISYVLEAFDPEDRNLPAVSDVFKVVCEQYDAAPSSEKSVKFLDEWSVLHPDSFAARKYRMFKGIMNSDKTWACIQQFLSNALDIFDYENARKLFAANGDFRISDLGKRKSVLFLNISDTDRSLDKVINIFYSQAFQILCSDADSKPSGRLDVPVRIILDDFATNVNIADFDKLISVIRSREISVSIILQSISQLETLYSKPAALTIMNGCDHILYLGGNDLDTASFISSKVFKTVENVMCLPNEKAYLITRGEKGELVDKVIPDFTQTSENTYNGCSVPKYSTEKPRTERERC